MRTYSFKFFKNNIFLADFFDKDLPSAVSRFQEIGFTEQYDKVTVEEIFVTSK